MGLHRARNDPEVLRKKFKQLMDDMTKFATNHPELARQLYNEAQKEDLAKAGLNDDLSAAVSADRPAPGTKGFVRPKNAKGEVIKIHLNAARDAIVDQCKSVGFPLDRKRLVQTLHGLIVSEMEAYVYPSVQEDAASVEEVAKDDKRKKRSLDAALEDEQDSTAPKKRLCTSASPEQFAESSNSPGMATAIKEEIVIESRDRSPVQADGAGTVSNAKSSHQHSPAQESAVADEKQITLAITPPSFQKAVTSEVSGHAMEKSGEDVNTDYDDFIEHGTVRECAETESARSAQDLERPRGKAMVEMSSTDTEVDELPDIDDEKGLRPAKSSGESMSVQDEDHRVADVPAKHLKWTDHTNAPASDTPNVKEMPGSAEPAHLDPAT